MKNRKLMIVLIVVLTLAVLAACLTAFVHITKGEVEEKDGIKQNSRIYLDNVRYEDGKIYYTVVNKTCRRVTWGGFKLDGFHKYENGKWAPLTIDGGDADIGRILKPFQQSGELYYDRPYLAPGDYRIILTSNDFAMVGYLTVT